LTLLERLAEPVPLLMGILNLTPDSFSDGGRYNQIDAAVAHALGMVAEGAAIIDVGAESTRPGSLPVPPELQIKRSLDVIRALRAALPVEVSISIDTRSAEVAEAALAAGAGFLNDVSAGADPDMLRLAAAHAVPICLMHMQGTPETMQLDPRYQDVVTEVVDYLQSRIDHAESLGVARAACVIDPGIGFGKTRQHNLALLRALPRLVATGAPVLLGTSRKRFMGALCRETEPTALVGATCATTALAVQAGVRILRVHDVRENRQAAEVAAALAQADEG
jgi:dihydropteroate synthase